jgi:hypothetical protein
MSTAGILIENVPEEVVRDIIEGSGSVGSILIPHPAFLQYARRVPFLPHPPPLSVISPRQSPLANTSM